MNKTVTVSITYPVGKKIFLLNTILNNFDLIYRKNEPTTIFILEKSFDNRSAQYYAYICKYDNPEMFDLLRIYARIQND